MNHIARKALLWKYHELRNGEFTVKIRISKNSDTRYLKTGFTSKVEYWDEETDMPKTSHPKFKELSSRIEDLFENIDFEIKLAERNGESLDVDELKERVESAGGRRYSKSKMKLFAFYDIIIDELEDQGKIATANLVAANKSIISKVFGRIDRSFTSFSEDDFKKIEERVNSVRSESSKSLYLRTFYRIWNIAIERKYCPKTLHPKNTIRFKAYKRIKTRKRAIPIEYIHTIERLEFPYESREFRSQQYLIFCFYTRGITYTDFAMLKYDENINKGRIRYTRSKNKRRYEFELHTKAQKVVEIFENYPQRSNNGHVFPILEGAHDTPRKVATKINSALKDFNEDLLLFERMTNCPKHITSYCIRHSFATCLRDKKVDIAIIKEAMGHETELQTVTYLDEINESIVTKEVERALL